MLTEAYCMDIFKESIFYWIHEDSCCMMYHAVCSHELRVLIVLSFLVGLTHQDIFAAILAHRSSTTKLASFISGPLHLPVSSEMAVHPILLLLGARLVVSQTSITLPDPARCVAGSGVTAFSACGYVYSQFATCSAYAAASSAYDYYNCFCAQSYFNALFDCNSEERLCLGTGQQIDQQLSNQVSIWHSECDPHLAYTPTTPVQSSITASYSTQACSSAKASCSQLTNARVSCTQNFQSGNEASLTSCLCQPGLLTLAYGCSVLGNVSCIQVPAYLTQMAEYGHCSNLQQVLTIPASLVSSPYKIMPCSSRANRTVDRILGYWYHHTCYSLHPKLDYNDRRIRSGRKHSRVRQYCHLAQPSEQGCIDTSSVGGVVACSYYADRHMACLVAEKRHSALGVLNDYSTRQ